jgi:ATP-dependent Lon protease
MGKRKIPKMTDQDNAIIVPQAPGAALSEKNKAPAQLHPEPSLPLMPLRNLVIFPGMIQSLAVGRPKSLALTQQAALSPEKIFLVAAQRDTEEEDPPFGALYHVACTVRILKLLKMPDGTQTTVVQGIARAKILGVVQTDPFFVARFSLLQDQIEPGKQLDALVLSARQLVTRMAGLSSQVPDEAAVVVNNLTDPGQIADFVVANLNYDADRKQQFLEELDVRRRLEKATELMGQEIEVLELARKIQTDVKTNIDKTQRDYFLREQMKAIQTELGVEDERGRVVTDLKARLDKAGLPEAVRKEADRELQRLEAMPVQAPDFSVSRTYLEYLADLPWNRSTGGSVNLRQAERILDADHYGLAKVKKRILEFLAVNRLKGDMKGPILCLVGPPGVGKTSLGRSVARATGRRFVRISLGGVRDEAEIRGHRRTYVGALPGRIIQELRKAEANDPVFMLDEIDKLGADFRGDPTSALLEVLDPEQNSSFTDHYLDVPFDLSKVMFITTANILDPVPAALLDRMEVIYLPGYTEVEKLHIARRYLVPRTLANNGLKPANLHIHDDALRAIIRHYTREAGVRNLEREIAAICRSVARVVAERRRRKPGPTVVRAADVESYLGPPQVMPETAERTKVPGVATGLGWTPMGGDILFIEATSMAGGSGNLIVTGQIGNVMRESAQTAFSYVRSRAADFGLDPASLLKRDVHVHVPAGAIPKDGPSAGIAILTAMVSLFSGRVVRSDVAMTGEITLRGMILPVGGIKEKILAAARAGIRTVILPEQNKKDLAEVAQDIRDKMKFLLVRRMEEVIPLALHDHKASARLSKASVPSARAAKTKTVPHVARPTGIAARKKPQS